MWPDKHNQYCPCYECQSRYQRIQAARQLGWGAGFVDGKQAASNDWRLTRERYAEPACEHAFIEGYGKGSEQAAKERKAFAWHRRLNDLRERRFDSLLALPEHALLCGCVGVCTCHSR